MLLVLTQLIESGFLIQGSLYVLGAWIIYFFLHMDPYCVNHLYLCVCVSGGLMVGQNN